MRAYQLPKGGAGIDTIVQVERPTPKPLYRQVLVKVAACSLNYRDLVIARSDYRMPIKENVIPACSRRSGPMPGPVMIVPEAMDN